MNHFPDFPNFDARKNAARTPLDGATPGERTAPTPQQFHVVNPVDLLHKPVPTREWLVEDWLPVRCVTANYGDGGTGKTLLAQQLMTSCATGAYWCGREVMQCRSIGFFCEDDEEELHARQAAICATYGISIGDLEAMRWVSGVGQDNSLMAFDAEGAWPTPLYERIRHEALQHRARLVVVDTAADTFSGNENDRHEVRRFIGQLNRLAIDIAGAVLLNAHPSRAGLSTGNLDGGSTGWNNSVRSRWSLARPGAEDGAEPDNDSRILTRRKANYASIGEEIRLRWRAGVLVPENGAAMASGAPAKAAAEKVFLDLLSARMRQNVFVSHNSRAGNYAPKVFAKCAERQGYTAKEFEAAMGRLFDAHRIVAESYGRRGDERRRITLAADVEAPHAG